MIHATETTSNTLPILWKKLTVCEIVLTLHEWERAHQYYNTNSKRVSKCQNDTEEYK